MRDQSKQSLALNQELVKEKQSTQKQETVKAYGVISMIYMYLCA